MRKWQQYVFQHTQKWLLLALLLDSESCQIRISGSILYFFLKPIGDRCSRFSTDAKWLAVSFLNHTNCTDFFLEICHEMDRKVLVNSSELYLVQYHWHVQFVSLTIFTNKLYIYRYIRSLHRLPTVFCYGVK